MRVFEQFGHVLKREIDILIKKNEFIQVKETKKKKKKKDISIKEVNI